LSPPFSPFLVIYPLTQAHSLPPRPSLCAYLWVNRSCSWLPSRLEGFSFLRFPGFITTLFRLIIRTAIVGPNISPGLRSAVPRVAPFTVLLVIDSASFQTPAREFTGNFPFYSRLRSRTLAPFPSRLFWHGSVLGNEAEAVLSQLRANSSRRFKYSLPSSCLFCFPLSSRWFQQPAFPA